MSMSRFDGPEGIERDPAQPYLTAFQSWESMLHERGRIEHALGMGYVELLTRYREKCAECDREKRNAMIWEKEQRMSERELNSLKTAAVSPLDSTCRRPIYLAPSRSSTPESHQLTLPGIIPVCLCHHRRRWCCLPRRPYC